jgi:hypothetical protein
MGRQQPTSQPGEQAGKRKQSRGHEGQVQAMGPKPSPDQAQGLRTMPQTVPELAHQASRAAA